MLTKDQNNCFEKRRYYDKAIAQRKAKELNFRVYNCPVCSFYHLTKDLKELKPITKKEILKKKLLEHVTKFKHNDYTCYGLSKMFDWNSSTVQYVIQELIDEEKIYIETKIENNRYKKILRIKSNV